MNAYTAKNHTVFFCLTGKDKFREVFKDYVSSFTKKSFDEDILNKEKNAIENELNQRLLPGSSPFIYDILLNKAYGEHSYQNQIKYLAKKGGGELDKATAAEKATCTSKSLATTREEDYEAMLTWADEIIGKPLRANKPLQAFIAQNKPKIYADSLLFTLGLKEQLELGKDKVTLEELERLLKTFSSKTSDDISNLYPKLPDICLYSTQASLVILYTILKNLNIPAFELVQTDYMESFLDTALNQSDKKG
jgi:hypothetical protein